MTANTSVKKLPSLSRQLTQSYLLAFSVFLILTFASLFIIIGSILDAHMDEDLQEDLEEFQLLYEDGGMDRIEDEIRREAESSDIEEFFIQVLDNAGAVLVHTPLEHWRQLAIDAEIVADLSRKPWRQNDEDDSDEIVAADTFDEDEEDDADENEEALNQIAHLISDHIEGHEAETRILYGKLSSDLILVVGESTQVKQDMMTIIFWVIVILLLVVLPVIAVVGWFIAARSVREIASVSRVARQVDQRHLDQQVETQPSSAEVFELTQTFNAMLKRINNLITEMRELTDNVAHDLRSPLARIRALAETTLSNSNGNSTHPDLHKKIAEKTIEECDRLLQMVNTNLDISEWEAGIKPLSSEVFSISSVVQDACELFDAVAEEKHIEFHYRSGGDCQVVGNVQALQRMLANIIDNAIKYTPDHGHVSVEVDCTSDQVLIRIEDDGSGIPTTEYDKIFDRFYRCDQSRSKSGCGLGLCFARAVAQAHSGNIDVAPAATKGSVFTITIPKYVGP